MIKYLLLFFFISKSFAYVPTVESLFRHGPNPDVTTNGISISLALRKTLPESSDQKFYKIYLNKNGDTLRIAQAGYGSRDFYETSIQNKSILNQFSGFYFGNSQNDVEKGLFYSMLYALTYNSGAHLMNYLKTLGVPVRLNSELINRSKVELLADYKRYMVLINKNRSARKTEVNPLQPQDSQARERVQAIMAEPMYTDTKQVTLVELEGKPFWRVSAGSFEALFSYIERDLQKLSYTNEKGGFSVELRDYWRANGHHSLPRIIQIKTLSGNEYQLETLGMRHYSESEDEFIRRSRNWDQALKGKNVSEPSPEFFL